jgi:hypothetical protein
VPNAAWVAAADYYSYGDDWATRTDACRLDCPRACANAIANDTEFRRSLYDGDVCPVGSFDTPILCAPGYYMNNDRCVTCPDGYTSNAGATSQNQCFTSCTTQCAVPTCPDNANCSYGNEIASGNLYYDTDSCDAVAPTCSMTFTCKNGYTLVDGACVDILNLHVGENSVMQLSSVRPSSSPVMVFDVDGKTYYGQLSDTEKTINTDTNTKYHVLYNDKEYWLHDYTAQ